MAAVNLRHEEGLQSQDLDVSFYKDDRPRRIDLTISFFGDDDSDDTSDDRLLEALSSEWEQ